jgi:hypothetical protein
MASSGLRQFGDGNMVYSSTFKVQGLSAQTLQHVVGFCPSKLPNIPVKIAIKAGP